MPIEFDQFLAEGHTPTRLENNIRKTCPLHATRKRTRTQCGVCEVGLCDMVCFANWHFDKKWKKKKH